MKKPVFELRIRIGKKNFYIRSDNSKVKIFTRVLGVFVFVLIFGMMISKNIYGLKDYLTGRNVWNYPVTVAHAGGMIGGYTYTNSKDAILYNYQKGHRTFEVDFSVTSDNVLVGQHDWENVVQSGVKAGEVPTKDEFMSKLIYDEYTPMTFQDVCILLKEYPDMWIVTDTKNSDEESISNDIRLVVETAKVSGMEEVLDRIVIQVYTPQMYEVVKDVYKFDNWIFTLYQYWDGDLKAFEDIVEFCRKSEIGTITVSNSRYVHAPGIVSMTQPYGIKIYVHTVNEVEDAQKFLDEGVWGIYTDSINPEELRRNEE